MDSKGIKRKREPNFTQKEERILIISVKKYVKIVENKTTDAINNAEKLKGWEKIYKEFNQNNDRHRSVKAIREKYENLKKRAKKVFAEEKMYNKGTGGGPYKDFGITDVDLQIKEILGKRLEGRISHWDGDCSDSEENSFSETQTSFVLEDCEVETELDPENEENVQFASWEHNYDQPSSSSRNLNLPRVPFSKRFIETNTNEQEQKVTDSLMAFSKCQGNTETTWNSREVLTELRFSLSLVIELNLNAEYITKYNI